MDKCVGEQFQIGCTRTGMIHNGARETKGRPAKGCVTNHDRRLVRQFPAALVGLPDQFEYDGSAHFSSKVGLRNRFLVPVLL